MQTLPLSTFCFAKGSCMVKDSKYNHGYVPTGIPNCFQISDHAEKWYIFQVHQRTNLTLKKIFNARQIHLYTVALQQIHRLQYF